MRDGYKLTEVGFIPEDWEHKTIGEISEFVGSGITPRGGQSVYKIEGVPFIRSQNVYPSGLRLDDVAYIDESQHQNMIRTEVKPGDVLLNITGASIGRCTAVPSNFVRGNVNQHVCIIRSNSSIFPIFLGQYLSSKSGQDQIDSFNTGSSREGLNFQQVRSIKLPFPPLPEQQKIADILTTVDDHISETEALIEKTKVLKQGLMQQLLTKGIGHTEFKDTEIGRIPVEWEVRTVGSLGSTYNGLSGKSKNDFGSGSPFITYKSIFDSSLIDLTRVEYVQVSPNENQNTAKYGDLFFTTSSETPDEVGMCSALLEDTGILYLNSFCFGYRINSLDQFDPNFARYMFRGNYFRKTISKIGQGSTRYNLSKTAMMQVKIPLPPLPEQRQIAAILTSVDDQIDTYQAKLASLTKLKTGLMQQLLTGKIRVKV